MSKMWTVAIFVFPFEITFDLHHMENRSGALLTLGVNFKRNFWVGFYVADSEGMVTGFEI